MKNSFGSSVSVTLFGESHGEAIGIVIDGLAPGIDVDFDSINFQLARRRPESEIDTPRREKDNFSVLSGVFNGKTTGTPVCITIPNENTKSKDYFYGKARPSHADYSAYCKYHGYEDYRGGGHFSGRVTAALCAAGGIIIPALEKKGIKIATHILRCADVEDRQFDNIDKDIEMLKSKKFPVLDDIENKIREKIIFAGSDNNSVGGITQTVISGVEPGTGEPWFDSVEGVLSHILFSLGGIKGVEFGSGFDGVQRTGKEFNDELEIKDGKIITLSNNNGGINGGITNGMPIVFQCAVKPTPSIAQKQKTVDFIKNENTEIQIKGRHDPAIIRRICPVIDSVTAIALCDLLCQRYGTDYLTKEV